MVAEHVIREREAVVGGVGDRGQLESMEVTKYIVTHGYRYGKALYHCYMILSQLQFRKPIKNKAS